MSSSLGDVRNDDDDDDEDEDVDEGEEEETGITKQLVLNFTVSRNIHSSMLACLLSFPSRQYY